MDELTTSPFADTELEGPNGIRDFFLQDHTGGLCSNPANRASHGNWSDAPVRFAQGHASSAKVGFQGFRGAVPKKEVGNHFRTPCFSFLVGGEASPVLKPRSIGARP